MTELRALQLCPNDHPPFLDLCRNHASALERAGMVVDTVFFGAPRGERWDAATYFGIERDTRRMTAELNECVAGRKYRLVVAHRYRAHQVAIRARQAFADATVVTIAHEFGMCADKFGVTWMATECTPDEARTLNANWSTYITRYATATSATP